MPVIELLTEIAAPIDRVFDLSLSIDLHIDCAFDTGEQAVAGVTSGLISAGQTVTWRARHFGIWQELTVQITSFDRPKSFTDTMLRGAFREMEHHHLFETANGGTTMRDSFRYTSPFGILGRMADALFLERYMRSFLIARNQNIKTAAESDGWKRYLL